MERTDTRANYAPSVKNPMERRWTFFQPGCVGFNRARRFDDSKHGENLQLRFSNSSRRDDTDPFLPDERPGLFIDRELVKELGRQTAHKGASNKTAVLPPSPLVHETPRNGSLAGNFVSLLSQIVNFRP